MGTKITPMQVPGKCDIILLFTECYIVPWHCIVFIKPSLLVAGAVFYLSNFFGWLPVNDANIIENLIFENNMSAVIFAIIREISFAIIIIIFSYFKFQKKDILNNEKK